MGKVYDLLLWIDDIGVLEGNFLDYFFGSFVKRANNIAYLRLCNIDGIIVVEIEIKL